MHQRAASSRDTDVENLRQKLHSQLQLVAPSSELFISELKRFRTSWNFRRNFSLCLKTAETPKRCRTTTTPEAEPSPSRR